MNLIDLECPNGEQLLKWERYFYKLGWELSTTAFENSLLLIYAPYSNSIVPLITAGFFQRRIRLDYQKKIDEYKNILENKIHDGGGAIKATYIWSGKRYKGILKNDDEGFVFSTSDGVDIFIKKKFVLKINTNSKDELRFRHLEYDIKKFIEIFYNIDNMEYLSSIDPIKFEIWGKKSKHKSEFDRKIKVSSQDYTGRFIDLLGITGKRGGNYIDKFLVSELRLNKTESELKDLIIFDKGVTFLKGSNMTKAKLKLIVVDSFESHLDDVKREFINERMRSVDDVNLNLLSSLEIPDGVEISGFKTKK